MATVHLECGYGGHTGPDGASYRREHPRFPIEIGALRFSVDEMDHADWLVTATYVSHPFATPIAPARRILVVTEPNGYFPPEYINQFGILVSPFNVAGFCGIWHQSHGALISQFGADSRGTLGRLDYNGLTTLAVPEKRDVVTAVLSRKTILAGHRQRLKFVRRLSAALGEKLEIYGRGFRPVADKADVILPNKYHLVLENTVMASYWTEKLADAYLGYAFPFVSGPPDLGKSFPPESFLAIDIRDPDQAVDVVRRAMADDFYAQRREAIIEARRRLIQIERFCPLMARVITAHPNEAPRLTAPQTIHPAPRPPFLRRVHREIARAYWQIDERARHHLRGRGQSL